MTLFSKLFGNRKEPAVSAGETRPPWMREGLEVELRRGPTDLNVVGEASYQDNLWRAAGARRGSRDKVRVDIVAVLVPESDNPYDENAISVWVNALKVGYLSREDAQRYRTGLLTLQEQAGKPIALEGAIAGGGIREDGPGRLGVFLRHDPSDFGLRRRPPPVVAGTMMTGLSEAIATDIDDDSYDLDWLQDLPSDPLRAISMLRRLLESEADAVDRHFMFHHLEEALYRSRDAFASALDEYDACCHQHDVEMDSIRTAFIAKWGRVPRLQTYHQMCIRLAKAKRFEDALRWAERGVSMYGENSARPDALEDLVKRAESYRAKLGPPRTHR